VQSLDERARARVADSLAIAGPEAVDLPLVAGHPNSRLDKLLPWTYPSTPDLKAVA
jgi:hypothetical protein